MYKAKKILGSVLIALLIVCLILSVVGIGYYTDGFTNFVKVSPAPVDVVPAASEANNLNVVIDEDHNSEVLETGQGIVMEVVRLSGTQTLSSSSPYPSQVLTATVYPDDVSDKSVEWSVSFVNPSSTWASGKNVSDYIEVIPESSGSTVANIYCYNPFSEKILITVTSRVNSSAFATCIVDFEKKFTEDSTLHDGYLVKSSKVSSFLFGSGSDFIDCNVVNLAGGIFVPVNFNATTIAKKRTVAFRPVYSDFTIDDDLSLSYYSEGLDNYYFYTAQVSNAFSAALNSVGISCVSGNTITQSGSDKLTDVIAAMVGYPSFDVYSGTSGEFASKFNSAARIVANNTDVVDFSITVCIRTEKVICDFKYDFKFDNSDSYLSVNNLSLSNSSLIF